MSKYEIYISFYIDLVHADNSRFTTAFEPHTASQPFSDNIEPIILSKVDEYEYENDFELLSMYNDPIGYYWTNKLGIEYKLSDNELNNNERLEWVGTGSDQWVSIDYCLYTDYIEKYYENKFGLKEIHDKTFIFDRTPDQKVYLAIEQIHIIDNETKKETYLNRQTIEYFLKN